MKYSNKQDLTSHIKHVLNEHKEPYMLGSWENFQKYKVKKKRRRITLVASIAASILLGLGSMYMSIQQHQITTDTNLTIIDPPATTPGNVELVPNQPASDLQSQTPKSTNPEIASQYDLTPEYSVSGSEIALTGIYKEIEQRNIDRYFLTQKNSFTPIEEFQKASTGTDVGRDKVFEINQMDNKRFSGETGILVGKSGVYQKNIDFSIGYASVLNFHKSQTDFGVGGGIYAGWNVSNEIAFATGLFVSQNQLKYKQEHGVLAGRLESETTLSLNGELSHVNVDLISLEIPLHLRYSIGDNLSLSFGISSVTFLKEKYNYTFEYTQSIQVFEDNPVSGPEPVTRVVTLKDTRQQTEPSMGGMEWAAFYTVAIGFKQDLADRHTFAVEPFLRIPAKRVASGNIKYTTGGLQLRVFF